MSLKGIFPIDKWGFNTNSVITDLPAAELDALMAHSSEQLFSKGEIIFREGSLPSGIFYMRTGMAKKYKVDKEGREQIIYVANSGELIGYHAVLAEERYPDNAAALEESLVGFIPKEDFLQVLDLSKTLSNRLLKTLSHEFTVFANSVVLFAQRSVRERFAMQLILMREKYKQGIVQGMEVEINLSREDLASLVGTARENIVRIIKDFKKEEILETRGRKIIIKDVEALLKAANY
ncbi:Crp/Fnr family transcriptional regulator [Flavisolibacter ginsengisoli]|jgi:CRP-like cAMP-binding protein|uniref:cAMP-binding domain of CRP or a regulatory subunit of cAMP-dependent protein kinases n=1 Tax=Flavisolibacter ginsengisoli DSM 18119 TaxID=1121884 RepID=A0A1M5DM14_9BACT|nr:Crp/Fnr family transcriptional regulator [Flavisolibacter ginsengisoli]SHF67812.1 cAMP-binding domain of CRP or a regulatory subunit of cAMP-dependent protein kinases [Flavisolibacter ginsengisoli DSM 18119]